jgi:hypothetical protein
LEIANCGIAASARLTIYGKKNQICFEFQREALFFGAHVWLPVQNFVLDRFARLQTPDSC